MRGVGEDVVLAGNLARLDVGDLLADLDEGVAEAVKLSSRFRLVETVIGQSLGNVGNLNTGCVLEGSDVQDELVSASALGVGVDDLVVGEEAGHDVVGVEESGTSLLGKTITTHHEDISVADGKNGSATPRSGTDGSNSGAITLGTNALRVDLRVTRQVRSEVLLDGNRTDTRATTTVGNTEGLVEVKMADISADITRRAKTDLGVHVGTVHVDETTVLVNKIADLLNLGLKDTKGGGVGNHDSSELISVLDTLGLEILNVQVTSLAVTLDGDDLHASHSGRGRVGTVGRNGDQANLSLLARASLVVGLYAAKTGKLTLSTRVGLQSCSVHTSDLGQVLGEGADKGLVTGSLLDRGEGVDVVDTGVGNGEHLGGGVELHGARAQRDHGVYERDILRLEVVDVSEKLGLGVVLVEDRLLEIGRFSLERSGDLIVEELGLVAEALKGDTLVEREANLVIGDAAEVDALRISLLVDLGNSLRRALESDSVEKNRAILAETLSVELELALLKDEALSETGLAPDILSDSLETLGTVIDSVESRHVGEKSLGSADVAGSLFTSNVLLTSLESKTKSRLSETILGNTNETTGDLALVLLRCGKEGSVGTTVAQRNTESLRVTNGNVSAKVSRGLEHGKSEQIGRCAEESLLLVDDIGEGLVVVDTTVGIGVLDQSANEVTLDFADELGVISKNITNDELDVEALSSGLQDGDGLGGSLVENRGIGNVKTGQIGDESLEVEEGLKATLADLSLVGSVAGIPSRVLENIALDNSRNKSSVVTSTDERLVNLVVLCELAHLLLDVVLGATINRDSGFGAALVPLLNEVKTLLLPPDLRGDSLFEELLHGAHGRVEHLEHFCLLARLAADVPP
ncbi:hypothetical protein HG531_005532 [Fusarium graminearum]|nr:hypothetical protein HG531_005532 [Fusarium graminearum]